MIIETPIIPVMILVLLTILNVMSVNNHLDIQLITQMIIKEMKKL